MKEINFLSRQNLLLGEQAKKDQLIFKFCLIGFVISLVIFGSLFATRWWLNRTFTELNTQTKQLTSQVTNQQPLEVNYLFFVNKLKIIKELFDMRNEKQVAVSYFTNLFDPAITITGLTYKMEEGILSLTVTSPSIFYLDKVINTLDDVTVREKFAALNKSSLKRASDASYSLDLTVAFRENSDLLKNSEEIEDLAE